jgi:hypothetical protein
MAVTLVGLSFTLSLPVQVPKSSPQYMKQVKPMAISCVAVYSEIIRCGSSACVSKGVVSYHDAIGWKHYHPEIAHNRAADFPIYKPKDLNKKPAGHASSPPCFVNFTPSFSVNCALFVFYPANAEVGLPLGSMVARQNLIWQSAYQVRPHGRHLLTSAFSFS